MILGECRSCGTITKEHTNDCQYVAIKDNIGLCTYCQGQDHRYAACPQRRAGQEIMIQEKRKNRKNNRKKGKVRIIAGIMTREQESDSTSPPEREEGKVSQTSPWKSEKEESKLKVPWRENPPHSMGPPREQMCSFCGVHTHEYKECHIMH